VTAIQQRNGWTKIQLAQRAGVNRGTIDNWARQPKPPLAATIVPVAERLGIDRDEALRLAGILTDAAAERDPNVQGENESGVDWMDRQYRLWKEDQEKGEVLRGLFKSWGNRDTG
jgi:transcriptional regulator with XRE-family HTH domain